MKKEDIEERLKQARAAVAGGATVVQACKQFGLGRYQYYVLGKSAKKTKVARRSKVIAIPETKPSGHMALIIGTPEQISQYARSYL